MSGSSDPFNISGMQEQPENSIGISPDFARNLALFGAGLSTSANARNGQGFLTYGSGFAGPFGAAVQNTMGANMDTARLRSQLGLQGAQTADVRSQALQRQIQNRLGLYNLNLTSGMYGGPQFDEQGNPLPPGQASPYSPFPQQQSQGAPQPSSSSGVPFAANNPLNLKFAGQDGAQNTNGFAAFPTPEAGQAATDKQFDLLAGRGVNTLKGLISTWAPPSENNTDAYVAQVSKDTGIPPDQQIDLQNPAVRALVQGSMARVEGNKNARVQIAQAGNGPIPLQGGGGQQYTPQAQSIDPIHTAQGILTGQLSNPTPEQARAAAPLIGRINPQLGAELMKYGMAGPTAASVAREANVDLRSGGMARIQGPNGQEWVKNPQLEPVQNPDGTISYAHITPPLPGSAPGTPGESTPVLGANGQPAVKQIAPQVQKARDKAAEDLAGKDTDAYISAQNTQSWLEQMNHAADTLNANKGFLGTGPTAPARLAFANNVNDILRTAGLPTVFDQNAVASWEELKKATTTAGFELSSHYEGHARQAAQTIMNATAAVPSEKNTPVGFHLVSSGIQESAQQAIDLHNFKTDIYARGGDLVKSEVDFYRANPAQMYARRAISTVNPYPITSDKELNRYLPGSFVSYKGKIVQVPERPGAPPIPEYLQNTSSPQAPVQ